MSGYDQSNQNVNSQYNAGRDIVIVSRLGNSVVLKVIKTDYKSRVLGVLGSTAGVDFELSKPHTLRYRRDAGLAAQTISVHIDGRQLLRREIFNPLGRIEFPFELENIDCEFVWQGYALVADVQIRVGGHEVFRF